MSYLKTKRIRLIAVLIILFMLFQIYKFLKVRITNMDLPKGKIVFSSYVDGDNEIYTMNINGSDLKQLTKNSESATNLATDNNSSFSTDGEKIVFTSGRQGQDTEIIYDQGGKPIGTRSTKTATSDIYIMDSSGINQIPLTHKSYCLFPFFSPDDKRIVFYGQREMRMMNSDGGDQRILNRIGGQIKFSPDGKKSFDNFQHDISVTDIDGVNHKRLTYFSGSGVIENNNRIGIDFDLSPDGEKVVVKTEQNNYIAKEHYTLAKFYTMDVYGYNLEEVYKLEHRGTMPWFLNKIKYSPDKKFVIFTAKFEEEGIYSLNLNDKTVANLTKGREKWSSILDFTFTTDGKRIVFVADIYPKNYYMHAVVLRNIKAYINYFLFRRQTSYYDNKHICIMDIDGKNFRKIAKLPQGSELGQDFIHWEK